MAAPADQPRLIWTAPQRRALFLLLSILCAALLVKAILNPVYIADPQVTAGARAAELATQLDPNTATWEELAAIPTLGEKRAKAIVDYREKALAKKPDQTVFNGPDDLTRIKGIRKATASNIAPYLTFPTAKDISNR